MPFFWFGHRGKIVLNLSLSSLSLFLATIYFTILDFNMRSKNWLYVEVRLFWCYDKGVSLMLQNIKSKDYVSWVFKILSLYIKMGGMMMRALIMIEIISQKFHHNTNKMIYTTTRKREVLRTLHPISFRY